MPNKPDYPDWRDTNPPKEEKPKKPAPLYPQENPERKGYGRLAADVIREEKERKRKAIKEATGE